MNAGLAGGEAVNPVEPPAERSGRPASPRGEAQPDREQGLWEQVFCRENLTRALQRVERNKGAPGVDGMTTAELRPWLHGHWPGVRRVLDEGTYQPSPVRRVVIPKPDGGERNLGVPTALDRLIQQAIAQVLTPIFDPTFSEYSYGFRPTRSAHQAVRQARGYVAEGYEWAVAVDLDKFFDRVNHDKLMARVARRVHDRRLLRLIRRYLEAGIMVDGVKQGVEEGTPQGSPLSPLLANIMLDDLDRELERRGHRFVRYADDLRIHVRSERAGERALVGIARFIERRAEAEGEPGEIKIEASLNDQGITVERLKQRPATYVPRPSGLFKDPIGERDPIKEGITYEPRGPHIGITTGLPAGPRCCSTTILELPRFKEIFPIDPLARVRQVASSIWPF